MVDSIDALHKIVIGEGFISDGICGWALKWLLLFVACRLSLLNLLLWHTLLSMCSVRVHHVLATCHSLKGRLLSKCTLVILMCSTWIRWLHYTLVIVLRYISISSHVLLIVRLAIIGCSNLCKHTLILMWLFGLHRGIAWLDI